MYLIGGVSALCLFSIVKFQLLLIKIRFWFVIRILLNFGLCHVCGSYFDIITVGVVYMCICILCA